MPKEKLIRTPNKGRSKAKKKEGEPLVKAKPLAFIIMPFRTARPLKKGYTPLKKDDLDTVYSLFTRILKRRGYEVRRAESPTDILRDIVLDLDRADLVVADVTGLNPNVMYELGIRHGFCKKTILVTQDINELPFDIAGYQCIKYGWVTDVERRKLSADISKLLSQLDAHADPRYGPVHTHLGAKALGVKDETHDQTVRRLKALSYELGYLSSRSVEYRSRVQAAYPKAVQKSKKGWSFDRKELPDIGFDPIGSPPFLSMNLPCCDLIIADRYIPIDYDSQHDITSFIEALAAMRLLMGNLRSLRDWVTIDAACYALNLDAITLTKAVDKRLKGVGLKLRTTKLLGEKVADIQKTWTSV